MSYKAINHWPSWLVRLFIFINTIESAMALTVAPVIAQSIATDGTLGSATTLAGPNYRIPQSLGLTVNSNLFHSFSRFNVGTGEVTIFESTDTIRNIFSRVTGGSISFIDGQIITQSRNANLFLINPAGIIFGSNASLNIGSSARGSFVVTTVDTLVFSNGKFSTKNPETSNQLLTIVGDPSGFLATQKVPGSIQNLAKLTVSEKQSLVLIGGNVDLIGGELKAPGGSIRIDSIADGNQTNINIDNGLSLEFRNDASRMNVSINGARLITSSEVNDAGDISIYGRNINSNSSSLITNTTVGNRNGGNITFNADHSVSLVNNSISTQAASAFILLPGQLPRRTMTGNGGSFFLKANSSVEANGGGIDTSSIDRNSGDIYVETGGTIRLASVVLRSSTSTGNAGNITLKASDIASLSSGSLDTSTGSLIETTSGNSGNIFIEARTLTIDKDTRISTATTGSGQGGNITLDAKNGSIAITNSEVRTRTNRTGNAGDIVLNATNSIDIAGILSSNLPGGLFTNTAGGGKAGNISVAAISSTINLKNGARIAVDSQGREPGGNILVEADNLIIDSQGRISAETASSQGGNINLKISNLFLLRRGGQISTTAGKAGGGGDGGNIRINAPFVVAIPNENSDITANAFTGRGGRVDITTRGIFGIAPQTQLTPLSDITASSQFGLSGVVTINTPDVDPGRGLLQLPATPADPSNQIRQTCRPAGTQQASSFVVTGRGGIPINPDRPIHPTPLIGWVSLEREQVGQVVSDRGEASKIQNRSTLRLELRSKAEQTSSEPQPNSSHQNPKSKIFPPLIEAQGWVKDAQGNVWLVSNVSTTPTNPDWVATPACP